MTLHIDEEYRQSPKVVIVRDHADAMDWRGVRYFTKNEFPEGVLKHLEAEFILSLEGYRDRLGDVILPSPIKSAWYRTKGSMTSRHYAVDRLSDAGDIFPQCDIRKALMVAMACKWWGGIGVYLDTTGPSGRPEPMLHLDMRLERKLWMRYSGRYIYPMNSQEELNEFFKRLGEMS